MPLSLRLSPSLLWGGALSGAGARYDESRTGPGVAPVLSHRGPVPDRGRTMSTCCPLRGCLTAAPPSLIPTRPTRLWLPPLSTARPTASSGLRMSWPISRMGRAPMRLFATGPLRGMRSLTRRRRAVEAISRGRRGPVALRSLTDALIEKLSKKSSSKGLRTGSGSSTVVVVGSRREDGEMTVQDRNGRYAL